MANRLWDARTRAKHWVGRHTMIPLEVWDHGHLVGYNGSLCWLCPVRTP